MDLELEHGTTGQKWSPFQPKANSRQRLRAAVQTKIFLKRTERARRMKELGLVPDNNEMGPSLEPDERDDDFVPDEDEEEREQENDQAIDDMLQDELAEVEAEAEVPVDPEADEADYETIEDDTQPMDDDEEPETELTEEEKAAKAEADALEAERLEEERIKREEEERKQRERDAIQRRKEQILELRKMALEDRAARKASRQNARNGLFEAEADESGSDFSDDDDEESAERQAIEELRGIDYLAANDKEDENTEAHRTKLAEQVQGDMESFLKQRGDVFDDDGKIIRHGRAMRKLLKKAQEDNEEDALAQQIANQSDSDTSDSSESDSDDDAPSHSAAGGASEAGAASAGASAEADAGTSRPFAFASNGVGEAAIEPTSGGDPGSAAAGDGLTEKQRKKLRKKNIKRMRRAVGSTSSAFYQFLHLFGAVHLLLLYFAAWESSSFFWRKVSLTLLVLFPFPGTSTEPIDDHFGCRRRENDGRRSDEHDCTYYLSCAVSTGCWKSWNCTVAGHPAPAANAAAPKHLHS